MAFAFDFDMVSSPASDAELVAKAAAEAVAAQPCYALGPAVRALIDRICGRQPHATSQVHFSSAAGALHSDQTTHHSLQRLVVWRGEVRRKYTLCQATVEGEPWRQFLDQSMISSYILYAY